MTTEAKDTTKLEGQPSTAPANAPPAGAPNGASEKPKAETKPEKVETKPEGEKKPKAGDDATKDEKKPKRLSADDDEVPEEEDLLQMSPRALKARLARASKAQLKEAFGTDDVDLIQKKIKAGEEYEAKKEEERKARLSAEEKLKEERDAAMKERDEAKTALEKEKLARTVEKQDTRITRIAERHLKSKHVSKFLPDLARAILKAADEGDKKLIKNEEAWIDSWFAKQIEEDPVFGKDFDANQPEKPEAKRLPFSNGARAERPTPDGKAGSPKTAAPGKPNSMSQKELNDLGYQWK